MEIRTWYQNIHGQILHSQNRTCVTCVRIKHSSDQNINLSGQNITSEHSTEHSMHQNKNRTEQNVHQSIRAEHASEYQNRTCIRISEQNMHASESEYQNRTCMHQNQNIRTEHQSQNRTSRQNIKALKHQNKSKN